MNKRLISFLIGVIALMPILATAQATYAKQATLIYPTTEKKVVVEVGSIKAQILLDSGYQLFKEDQHLLGFSVITDYAPSLTLSLNSTASVIPVSAMTTKDGTPITMSLLGSKVYLNIEPGGSNEEIVVCTGINGKTFTGCTRGLAFSGLSESSVLANQKSHNAGSQIIMSNVHYVYQNFVDLDSNQTITGVKNVPTPLSTSTSQIATVGYVNSVAYVGSPNAAEGVKGIVDLATQAQMASASSTGSTGASLVLQSKYASSTSSATTTIPVTNTSGKLDASFIDQTLNYAWTPVGSINAYATSTAPSGWMICNGTALSTSTYSALFSVIGYTFGGNGTSTFALPDLRGRQITMASSTNTYATSTGVMGGESKHTMTEAELAPHTHGLPTITGGGGPNQALVANGNSSINYATPSASDGSGTPFNVLDPYLALNYIIKY